MTKPDEAGTGLANGDFLALSARMKQIKEIAEHVADKDVPVLILGESGVGKEVVARHIHAHSAPCRRPFVKVNCAAVPHDLLESEFFGHERGAFTGAAQRRIGQFEAAADGTVLLDEIGEMAPVLQAKLLHVLQDHRFQRVGGDQIIESNARIVATTNVDLEEAVSTGKFRQDLFFRLAVITLELPPLRQRREEIPIFLDYFLGRYADQYGAQNVQLTPEARQALIDYDWPGNVRELQNAVRRYVLVPDQDAVMTMMERNRRMCSVGGGNGRLPREALRNGDASLLDIGADAAEHAEKQAVLEVLAETNWNRKDAAARLNVCYKTLLNKMSKWQADDAPAKASFVRDGRKSGPPAP